MTVSPDELHLKSQIKQVPLDKLHVDRTYQRDPSMALVERIAGEWDAIASELALVSDRGESGLWLVNGQHRSLAARKLGHKKIWARVVDLSQEEDPARIEAGFRLKTNVGLSDRPLERFKAQIAAGDSDSLLIDKIAKSFGTQINEKPVTYEGINAISTVEAIFSVDGTGDLLAEVLQLLTDSEHKLYGRAVSAANLKGLAWFIQSHADEVNRDRLVDKLKMTGMEQLHRRAATMKSVMGGATWMNYYRSVVDIWNEGLQEKSKLQFKTKGAGNFAARSKAGAVAGSNWGSETKTIGDYQ